MKSSADGEVAGNARLLFAGLKPCAGKAIRIADGIARPNGIQLSPDEQTLYVNNTAGEYLIAFDINPDGAVRQRRDFAKYEGVTPNAQGLRSGADGLAID